MSRGARSARSARMSAISIRLGETTCFSLELTFVAEEELPVDPERAPRYAEGTPCPSM